MSTNPDQWRRLAQEMRRIAEGLTLLERAQSTLLRIAEEYDRLAVRDERLREQKRAA